LFSLKRILQSWAIGVVAVFVSGALLMAAPSVGLVEVFTFPLWLLPTLVGVGASANLSVWMFLVDSLFYGAVFFVVLALIIHGKTLWAPMMQLEPDHDPAVVHFVIKAKEFCRLSEKYQLTFRAEMFNTANTPHHSVPDGNVSNGTLCRHWALPAQVVRVLSNGRFASLCG
jgi:hypothetical protein